MKLWSTIFLFLHRVVPLALHELIANQKGQKRLLSKQFHGWTGWLRDKECGEKADMDRGPCRPNVFAMDDVFMTERPEQVFIQTAEWSLSHSFLSDLWLWWDNKWWWELEWRSIAVESNLNKHSTHAFLICPNSDEAERPSQKIAYLLNPAREDFEPSVTLCRWSSLSQVSLHTHVQQLWSSDLDSTSPFWGRRTTEEQPRCCCCCCCCCPFAPRWTTGRPTNRRHLVMTPTDREADDCDCSEEEKAKEKKWLEQLQLLINWSWSYMMIMENHHPTHVHGYCLPQPQDNRYQ